MGLFIRYFFLYAGSKSAGRKTCEAQDVVLRLVQEVPRNEKFQLLFDNAESYP